MSKEIFHIKEALKYVVENVQTALSLPNLNYSYGYYTELNEKLQNMTKAGGDEASKKYPLIWLVEPYTIDRSKNFGSGESKCHIFIITGATSDSSPEYRFTNTIKPILYPIYYELLNQLNEASAYGIAFEPERGHSITERPYWGATQQEILDDIVDCIEITDLEIKLHYKL